MQIVVLLLTKWSRQQSPTDRGRQRWLPIPMWFEVCPPTTTSQWCGPELAQLSSFLPTWKSSRVAGGAHISLKFCPFTRAPGSYMLIKTFIKKMGSESSQISLRLTSLYSYPDFVRFPEKQTVLWVAGEILFPVSPPPNSSSGCGHLSLAHG